MASTTSKDLQLERQNGSINVEKMKHLLYGSSRVEIMDFCDKLVQQESAFSKENDYFLNHTETYSVACKRGKRLVELRREHNLSQEQYDILRMTVGSTILDLHHEMFLPTLISQCTDEQKHWITKAQNYEILGCYAQTELGHGSNVAGLETTSTYDPSTKEFVLNSPTLTSTKYWIGNLGKTATHAVVQARLILQGKDMGVHVFLVQVRDVQTHVPLKGIEVGDIGPKVGYNAVDNGFLRFSNVRIPREQMLMRFAQVSPDGIYSKPPHDKINYKTMTYVRMNLVRKAARSLAIGLTTAIRYTSIRRQFGKPEEKSVLNYLTVQHQLLPLLATAYAYQFVGQYLTSLFTQLEEDILRGDFSLLASVHASSAGLKSLATTVVSNGLETCRRNLGGHGYSLFSGVASHSATYVSQYTLEGENMMIIQQTTRYLISLLNQQKNQTSPRKQRTLDPVDYVYQIRQWATGNIPLPSKSDVFTSPFQVNVFRALASRALLKLKRNLDRDTSGDAWNNCLIEVGEVARAHCLYITVLTFHQKLQEISDSGAEPAENLKVLFKLRDLYCLYNIQQVAGDLLELGIISPENLAWVKEGIQQRLADIRPEAVRLVDSWGFSDYILNSALGRYDGNVYSTLLEWSKKEPLNNNDVSLTFPLYVKPILNIHSKL